MLKEMKKYKGCEFGKKAQSFFRKILLPVLILSMILPGAFVMGQESEPPKTGLFLNDRLLKDGDSIPEGSVPVWKQKVFLSEAARYGESRCDWKAELRLPEPLLLSEENIKDAALTDDKGNSLPLSVTEKDGVVTVTVTDSGVTGTGTTVSAGTVGASFLLSLPCVINQEKVTGDTFTLDGMTLYLLKRGVFGMPRSTDLPAYSAKLHRAETDPSGVSKPEEAPIAGGDSISLSDPLYLVIYKGDLKDITAGVDYTVPLPDAIGAPQSDGHMDVVAQLSDLPLVQQKYADLRWNAGGRSLTVQFLDFSPVSVGGKDVTLKDLIKCYMYFSCGLNNDQGQADDDGKIRIILPGGDSLTVTVNDWVPKGPEISKSVSALQSDGTAEWTVNYTHPTAAYKGEVPEELTDQLPEGLVYDTSSVKIEKNGVEDTLKTGLTYNTENTAFTYNFATAGVTYGDSLVITYKTKMTAKEFNRLWGNKSAASYPNTVKGINASHGLAAPVCSAQKDLKVPENWAGRTVIAKKAELIPGGDPGDPTNPVRIKWEVSVTASGRGFKKLHVIDTMGKGLILDQSTVEVKKTAGGGTPTNIAPGTEVTTETDGRTKMTIKLIDSPSGGSEKAGDSYTVTYTTAINSEYFNQTNPDPSMALGKEDVTNSATLTYEWPTGDEPGGTPFLPPSIGKGPGDLNFDSDLIKKASLNYNAAEHSLTWKITVNPNQVDLTKATIVDDLSDPAKKHCFVLNGAKTEAEAEGEIRAAIEAALAGITGSSSPAPSLTSLEIVDNKLTAVVENTGKKSFSFEFKTWASDPELWAGTSKFKYSNTAVLDHTGTEVSNTAIIRDSFATAFNEPSVNMLKKGNTEYNAGEKKITWKLIVNESRAALGAVDIEDPLPAGLSCDPADAQLGGAAFDQTDNTFTVDSDANTVKIHLNNVTDQKTVTFKTAVDVNTTAFQTKKEISFSNTASMTSDSNPASVSSNRSDIVLDNTVLNKTAVKPNLSSGKITAEYTVKLNPQRMNLTKDKGPGARVKLIDTLSDGLYLDTETVKLYQATPESRQSSPGGKWVTDLRKGAPVSPQPAVTYDATVNSFFLEVPDPEESYIAEYTVYAVRTNVPLDNQAVIEGSVVPGSAGHGSSEMSFTMNASGGASFSLPEDKFFSIQIKNVNESGNTIKGAAVFALYSDKSSTQPLVTATCDSNTGTCTLALPRSALGSLGRLYWRAVTPPSGYAVNNEWHEVDVLTPPTTAIPMVNVSDTDQSAGSIQILKTDGTVSLKGAKFELYEERECVHKVKDEASVADDGSLTFSSLYPGRNYWLKETQAPEGYVLPADPVEIKAERTPAETPIANERYDVTLEVTNVDAEDASVKLKGTEYILYEDAACQKPFGASQITDNNGFCSFHNLKPYGTYYLREKTASSGYVYNNVLYTVITQDNHAAVTLQPANHQIGWNARASVELTKTDADDSGHSGSRRLKGARFQLYRQDRTTLLDEKETDSSGSCTFTGLKEGTYYLKEVKAPDGYEIMNEWTQADVRMNTAERVFVANHPIGWNKKASLQVIKTDDSTGPGGALRLEGAVFWLYGGDQTTFLGEGTTDADGSCRFTGLKEGVYYLKEITAPEGYRLKEDLIKVTVRMNTAETVTVENRKIPVNNSSSGSGSGGDTDKGSDSDPVKKQKPSGDKTAADTQTAANNRIPKTNVRNFTPLWVTGIVLSFLAAGGICASYMLQNREIRKSGKGRTRGRTKKKGRTSQGV